MKVFKSEVCCYYGGGIILIAANSSEEALVVASEQSKYEYKFKDWDEELGEIVVRKCNELTSFTEIDNLEYHTDSPCIITESIYQE